MALAACHFNDGCGVPRRASCGRGRPADSAAVAAAAAAVPDGTFTRPEAGVPAAKRTTCGLYATAQDAYDMISEAPEKILFIDVRTPAELQFIGMPTLVDANVPVLLETSPPHGTKSTRHSSSPPTRGSSRAWTGVLPGKDSRAATG